MSGDHNMAQDREYHRKRGKEIMEQIHKANQPEHDQIIALAKQLGWNTEHAQTNVMLVKFAKEVAAAEREACAKMCDAHVGIWIIPAGPKECAAAIRSRA